MLYFSADPRDGGAHGSVCNTCCCEPVFLRPGETALMQINYAPWSLPIGYPGIVPGLELEIEASNTCATGPINGFVPPTNVGIYPLTLLNAPVDFDALGGALPAANTFTFAVFPFSGPTNGTVILLPDGHTFRYTPNNNFQGFDGFWLVTTDAQGRTVITPVVITVNVGIFPVPFRLTVTEPYIDRTKVRTDQRSQTISFPIFMPYTCRDCDTFRLTIRQPASDCDRNIYTHFMCFDIRCRDCA